MANGENTCTGTFSAGCGRFTRIIKCGPFLQKMLEDEFENASIHYYIMHVLVSILQFIITSCTRVLVSIASILQCIELLYHTNLVMYYSIPEHSLSMRELEIYKHLGPVYIYRT